MAINESFVFQADATIVEEVYADQSNYIVEYDKRNASSYCVIYCSSNDIYYPNTEIAFKESIIKKNKFEWYKSRVPFGYKHIFIRDIKKQWYLSGINDKINDPEKLFYFLNKETEGYKVIILGSSAGGFISVILGQLLNAERIYSFNGQFEILSLSESKYANFVDPLLYRNKNDERLIKYYDATNFIKKPESVFYFYSTKSKWDCSQNDYARKYSINRIGFKTSNHGIPFLKTNLSVVLGLGLDELKSLCGEQHHPIWFSLKKAGIKKTITGLKPIIDFILNKIYINTIQKFKAKKM